MTLRLPKIRLRPRPECRLCGSQRAVRDRRCPECRLPHPVERRLALRGWTVTDLAKRAGLSPATVHRLLADDPRVSDAVRARIGAAVRLDPDRLLRPRRTP